MTVYRPSQHPTWYCRRGNVVLGPVSTRVLHHYLFDGTLSDEDAGRVGLNGEWVPVVDLRRMFEEDGFTRQAVKDAKRAQSQDPTTQTNERAARSTPHAAHRGFAPVWPRRVVDGIAGLFDSLAGRLADMAVGSAVLIARGLRLRAVQLLLAIAFAAGAIWGVVLPNWPISATDELASYQALFGEIESLRETPGPDAAWDALAARLSEKIDESSARIRASATSLRPDFQNLMWAIDLFPKALAEARSGEIPQASTVAMVGRHLEQAERFINRQESLARRKVVTDVPDRRKFVIAGSVLAVIVTAWFVRRRFVRSRN